MILCKPDQTTSALVTNKLREGGNKQVVYSTGHVDPKLVRRLQQISETMNAMSEQSLFFFIGLFYRGHGYLPSSIYTAWKTLDNGVFTPLFSSSSTEPSLFLPDFLSPDPRTEHIAAAIKNDQVCICAGAKRALPTLNAETPRRIECHTFNRFTQRTSREAREVADAGVQGDDAEAANDISMDHRAGEGALGRTCQRGYLCPQDTT